jgi:membrane dipeptidase
MTDRHREVMLAGLREDGTVSGTLRRMFSDRLAELSESPAVRRQVGEIWKRSGVNGVLVTLGALELDPSGWDAMIRDAAHWIHRERSVGDCSICTAAEEVESARQAGKLAVVLGTQDAAGIGRDLGRLETLYGLGTRVVQLTYNYRNFAGDGCLEPAQAGLSLFGRTLVRRMNELGVIVDVSHCGYRTTLDAIDASTVPVAISHSLCAALVDHPRAKSDEQLRALRSAEGYMGIVSVPYFLKPKGGATLQTMLDHVQHAVEIMGIERVGIATDWGGWTPDMPAELSRLAREQMSRLWANRKTASEYGTSLPEFDAWEKWPVITEALRSRGFDEAETAALVGRNWLHYMKRSLKGRESHPGGAPGLQIQ